MLRLLHAAVFLCICYFIQSVPAPGHGALKGYCNTDLHCGKGECCVDFSHPKGKRAVGDLSPDLKKFVKGKCMKLGKKNQRCIIPAISPAEDRHFAVCPCRPGLQCEGINIRNVPIGEDGFCKPIPKQCKPRKHCRPGYCCVGNTLPKGKRPIICKRYLGHCDRSRCNCRRSIYYRRV